jgi:uncharacterized RmlC-like cupin family protein
MDINENIYKPRGFAKFRAWERGGGIAMVDAARLKSLGGVVRAGDSYEGKQGPNYIPGVSAQTVGSQALWLGSVTLPPRASS